MGFKQFLKEGYDYKGHSLEAKQKAINIMNEFKGQSGIPNPRWNDLKYLANKFVEYYWKWIQETYYYPIVQNRGERKLLPEEELYLSLALHGFESTLKKMMNIRNKSEVYKDFHREVEKFYKENIQFVNEVNSWRDKIVKRVPGEAKAKKAAEIHRILSTNVDVKNVVEMIAEEFRPTLEKDFIDWKTRLVLNNSKNGKVELDRSQSELRFMLMDYVNLIKYPTTYEVKKDWKEIIKKKSKENADMIIQDFVSKLVFKLNTILSKKENLKEAKRIGNVNSNEIAISFTDSSKFIVRSKIVYVTNSNGTSFTRYPTTFHDVYLPDGTKMGEVSEKTMIEIFALAK